MIFRTFYFVVTFAETEAKSSELVDNEAYLSERVSALNQPLACSGSTETNPDDDVQLDAFPTVRHVVFLTSL